MFVLAACGGEERDVDAVDSSLAPDTVEAEVGDGDAAEVEAVDAADGEAPPATLEERGHVAVRTIVHLHSAYSHDGCDDHGLDAEGRPDMDCVRRMKRALCGEGIGVAFMTDHPGHMRDQAFSDLLYGEPGDEVVTSDEGPRAIRYPCPDGGGGPDGRVTLYVGYEATHTMGIGLERHLEPRDHYGTSFEDTTPDDDLRAATEAVRAAGGLVTIAHSEEDGLSAATIARHDVAAMELYNFHANFKVVLGTDLGDKLFALEDFVAAEAEVPDPDLTALVMFDRYPERALTKWREVSAVRSITAFAGSDVHENVSLPAFCDADGLCDGLAQDYPNLVARLTTGGPVWQSDDERLDGYARIFGWVQNRVLVPATAAEGDLGAAVRTAFEAGRNVVVFEVLGDATGVTLMTRDASGAIVDMGGAVAPTPGLTLWARSPDLPLPGRRAAWTDGSAAAIESVLWKSTADGTSEVLRWSEPGAWRSLPLEAGAGASYHLEVWIVPHHLVDALGPAEALAHAPYRWVETNAIRVSP